MKKINGYNSVGKSQDNQPKDSFANRIAPRLFDGRKFIQNPTTQGKLLWSDIVKIALSVDLSALDVIGVVFNYDNVVNRVNALISETTTPQTSQPQPQQRQPLKLPPTKEQSGKKITRVLQDDKLGPITKMQFQERQKNLTYQVKQWNPRSLGTYSQLAEEISQESASIQNSQEKETRSKTEMIKILEVYKEDLEKQLNSLPTLFRFNKENKSPIVLERSAIVSEIKQVLEIEKKTGDNQLILNDLGAYLKNIKNQIDNLDNLDNLRK